MRSKNNKVTLERFLILLKEKQGVVEYIADFSNYTKGISIFKCKKHGIFEATPRSVIVNKVDACPSCITLSRRAPICGIGTNDVLCYDRRDYYLWYNVVRRGTFPLRGYGKVTCHEDWLLFSNFLKDLPLIDNFNMREEQGWELDKDLLSGDNKIYSKDTTCFLPSEINACIAVGESSDKKLGAPYDEEINKYYAYLVLDGKRKRFGSFETRDSAHEKYKELKKTEVNRLAEKYRSNLTDRVYEALKAWTP